MKRILQFNAIEKANCWTMNTSRLELNPCRETFSAYAPDKRVLTLWGTSNSYIIPVPRYLILLNVPKMIHEYHLWLNPGNSKCYARQGLDHDQDWSPRNPPRNNVYNFAKLAVKTINILLIWIGAHVIHLLMQHIFIKGWINLTLNYFILKCCQKIIWIFLKSLRYFCTPLNIFF